MRYRVTHYPNNENVLRLIEAAMIVEPQWATVIKCAFEGGIKTSIGRHLGPENLSGSELSFKHPLSVGPTRREIPDQLVRYLSGISNTGAHYCPLLHAMSTVQFANSWREVCTEAGLKIAMLALTWPWRDEHQAKANWERSECYLDHLASEWLTETEFEQLKQQAKKWVTMGSKSGNRKRLLTRAQILAPHN